MGRQTSFWVLVAVAVAVGFLFFRVVQPFLLPLLLASVITMLLRPYYEWTVTRCGRRRGLIAALFTLAFLLTILLPTTLALFFAGRELLNAGKELAASDWEHHPLIVQARHLAESYLTNEEWNDLKKSSVSSAQAMIGSIYQNTQSLLSNALGLVVGLAITSLALFYFLSEGPQLINSARRLSPLEDSEEEALLQNFSQTCRGVVLATVVCAFFQAFAAGIGFAIVGAKNIWLLAALTMFTSMIPFVGAAAVWLVVAAGLLWQGSWTAGIFLIIYGSTVVSSLDNLVRAYVIHDSAKLHPLVALISVLGALQIVGLWGIILGPIVASFFHAVLKILRDRNWDATVPSSHTSPNLRC